MYVCMHVNASVHARVCMYNAVHDILWPIYVRTLVLMYIRRYVCACVVYYNLLQYSLSPVVYYTYMQCALGYVCFLIAACLPPLSDLSQLHQLLIHSSYHLYIRSILQCITLQFQSSPLPCQLAHLLPYPTPYPSLSPSTNLSSFLGPSRCSLTHLSC